MSALSEGFKKEHAKIIAMLNEVKELGILSKEGQDKILSVKEYLLAHFKNEDEQFFSVLRKEAETNMLLESILALSAIDMKNVSKVVLEFFEKYFRGRIPDNELQKEFENIYAALGKRIKSEENILYDVYDEVYHKINQQ